MQRLFKTVLFVSGLVVIFYVVMTLTEKQRFLNHLYSSTPVPYKDCVVNYVDTHWDEAWADFKREGRVPRGRTDIVIFMVHKYTPLCSGSQR